MLMAELQNKGWHMFDLTNDSLQLQASDFRNLNCEQFEAYEWGHEENEQSSH